MDLAGGVMGDGSSKLTGRFDIKSVEKETETQAVVDSTDGATQRLACLWRFKNMSKYTDKKLTKQTKIKCSLMVFSFHIHNNMKLIMWAILIIIWLQDTCGA